MVCSAAITFQCPIYHCPLSFSPFLCLIASYTGNCCVVCHCESPSVYSNQTKSEQQLYRRVGERSAPIDACHVTAVRGPSWPDALTVLGNRNSSVLKAREKRFIIAISGEREIEKEIAASVGVHLGKWSLWRQALFLLLSLYPYLTLIRVDKCAVRRRWICE